MKAGTFLIRLSSSSRRRATSSACSRRVPRRFAPERGDVGVGVVPLVPVCVPRVAPPGAPGGREREAHGRDDPASPGGLRTGGEEAGLPERGPPSPDGQWPDHDPDLDEGIGTGISLQLEELVKDVLKRGEKETRYPEPSMAGSYRLPRL